MINKNEFISGSPQFYKNGTIVLLKTSTDTLKLLNPNANALMLGDATHEGGDIKVYRDTSGNLQLSVDADAASNTKAFDVYGGVVCQNFVTVGQTTLNTTYPIYGVGHTYITGNIYSGGLIFSELGIEAKTANDSSYVVGNIQVTGTDATDHAVKLQIDSNDIICARATGDGAGGITNKAVGLYGVTPATQAAAISDPAESIAGNNAAIDAILVALENIGILASS
jgi:hypothetical protein